MAILAGVGVEGVATGFLAGGATGTAGRDVFDNEYRVTADGSINTLNVVTYHANVKLSIKVWRESAGNFDFVSRSATLDIPVAGVNTGIAISPSLSVLAGDVISLHLDPDTSDSSVSIQDEVATTPTLYNTAMDTESAVLISGLSTVVKAIMYSVEGSLAGLVKLAGVGVSGVSSSNLQGFSTGIGRDFFDAKYTVTQAGAVSTIDVQANVINTPIKVKFWRPNGANYDLLATTGVLTLPLAGLNSDVSLGITTSVAVGDVVSLHIASGGSAGVLTQSDIAEDPTKWAGISTDYTSNIAQSVLVNDLAGAMMYAVNGFPSGDSITVADVDAFIQRSSGSISVTVSGSYIGTPTSIRRKVVYTDDSSTVSDFDWAVYIATPSGEVFSGSEIVLPESDRQYRVELDFSNDAGVTASTNGFNAADKWLIYGQSLARRLSSDGSDITANALSKYADAVTGAYTTPTVGNGATTFLNDLVASTGFAQVAVNPAVGDMTLLESNKTSVDNFLWDPLDPDTVRYLEVKAAYAAVGSSIAGAIYVQGETDAGQGNDLEDYKSSLTSHFAQLRADTRADLPIIISPLGYTLNTNPTDLTWNIVQQAHIEIANEDANIFYTVKYDLPLFDNVHLTDAANTIFGNRLANNAIANILGGSADWEAPIVASIEALTLTSTRINLTQGQGTDFTPTTGITGIELTESGDAYGVSGITAARETAASILVTHDAATVTAGRLYYGKEPVITGIVLDNSTLNIPLSPATMSVLSSTISIEATGIPDGDHVTYFYDQTNEVGLSKQTLTYASNAASATLSVDVGTTIWSFAEPTDTKANSGFADIGDTE